MSEELSSRLGRWCTHTPL